MQMRSRKQRQGRRYRSRRSLKGGAQSPYNYEGTELTIDNPFTHIAVNQNDGTYNFNIPEKKTGFFSKSPAVNFERFCELFQYYQQNNKISCIHQQYRAASGKMFMAPSFVDILAISLILVNVRNSYGGTLVTIDNDLLNAAFTCLLLMVNQPQQFICSDNLGTLLINNKLTNDLFVKKIQKIHPTFDTRYITTLPIGTISEMDINSVLKIFKQAIFYYRYGVVPLQPITFDNTSTPDKAIIQLAMDDAAREVFKTNSSNSESWASKISLYTEGPLKLALAIQEGQAGQTGVGGKRTKLRRTIKSRRMRRKY